MIKLIHKEGHKILLGIALLLTLCNFAVSVWMPLYIHLSLGASLLLFTLILQFFRNPRREIRIADNQMVYAPADGKIVAIEETEEQEYFGERRLQVSIFMSPTNVHVNRNPISGKVNYFKYHPGKYLVAWHPKSSEENERTTVVICADDTEILLRQIAGAMAKRIKTYLDEGDEVVQGSELGFIKFGSRVDVFLPLSAKLNVRLGQKVKGNRTVIARL